LQSVSARLVQCVRDSDTVSRHGGDEFVVVLSEIDHGDDAGVSAQRIIDSLVAPHAVAHHHLHVTATIGISIYPADGQDADTLITCADTAISTPRRTGGTTTSCSSERCTRELWAAMDRSQPLQRSRATRVRAPLPAEDRSNPGS
jgi:diguanylate cyclase (GGDEF)-like protein